MKTQKKIILGTLAVTMGATGIISTNPGIISPITAHAEQFGDFTYVNNGDGTAKITKYTGLSKDVTIPSEVDGLTVTTIGPDAFKSLKLTSVSIPDTVTTIGASAFRYNDFTDLVLPDSVTTLGDYAFSNTNNLTNLTISKNLKAIPNYAFHGGQIANLTIPEGVVSIGTEAFSGHTEMVQVSLPSTLTTIGSLAFKGNIYLKDVTFPPTVTSIAADAFQGTGVTVPINQGITETRKLQAGDYVLFGGQEWTVAEMIDGSAFLVMRGTSPKVVAHKNEMSGDNFVFYDNIKAQTNTIIADPAQLEWIKDTAFRVDKFDTTVRDSVKTYPTTPLRTYTQKIGALDLVQYNKYKGIVKLPTVYSVLGSTNSGLSSHYYTTGTSVGSNSTTYYNTYNFVPVLTLKASHSYITPSNEATLVPVHSVENFTVEKFGTGARLAWNLENKLGVVGYEINREGLAEPIVLSKDISSYDDSGLIEELSYNYTITVLYEDGVRGEAIVPVASGDTGSNSDTDTGSGSDSGSEPGSGDNTDPQENTSNTDKATFGLLSGLLELTTSPVITFGDIEMPNEITKYKTSFEGAFNVKDFRGTQEGWRVDVSASPFKVAEPEGGFAEGTSANVLPAGTLTLEKAESIVRVGEGNGTLPTNKLTGTTVIDDGTVSIIGAEQGTGMGEFNITFPEGALSMTLNPETIKVDKENYPNGRTPYESTLRWDLVQAP